MKKKIVNMKGNHFDLEVNCDCGKPITEVNEYGMFCEDFCKLEEAKDAKDAKKRVENIINSLIDRFGGLKQE